MAMLQSPQPLPAQSIFTPLLNELSTIPDNFIIILDDYHIVDSKQVDESLTFLLKHMPPQMHEPASILLKRIQEEKAKTEKVVKAKKKAAKKRGVKKS